MLTNASRILVVLAALTFLAAPARAEDQRMIMLNHEGHLAMQRGEIKGALALFQKSCAGGFKMGCRNIGNVYFNMGAPLFDAKKYPEALKYFSMACDNMDEEGCYNAGLISSGMPGVAADEAKTFSFLNRSCKFNYKKACDLVAQANAASKSATTASQQSGNGASQGGGGSNNQQGKSSKVADMMPVNNCVRLIQAGQPGAGNYGAIENTCSFDIDVRFCNDKAKKGSWADAVSCLGGGANWGGSTSVKAHQKSADHIGGQTYWFACKKPAGVVEASFVKDQGIKAKCR